MRRNTRAHVSWGTSGLVTAVVASAVTAAPAAAARDVDAVTGLPAECSARGKQVRCLWTTPSAIPEVFTVPTGVVNLKVLARGGSGGPGDADQSEDCTDGAVTLPGAESVEGAEGGVGGTASAILNVEPGQVLDLYVGGMGNSANGITGGAGGINGGAPGGTVQLVDVHAVICDAFNQFGGGGGGGGGGSFVMAHNTHPAVAVPLLAAGGGGGGGGTYASAPGGRGGAGGGEAGDPGNNTQVGGAGGTALGGGGGGPNGENGSRGLGGLGAPSLTTPGGGGGGGGGYFGGGGGGITQGVSDAEGAKSVAAPLAGKAGGGGGGSGFVASSGPGVRLTKGVIGPGSVTGPGEISISFTRRIPSHVANSAQSAERTGTPSRSEVVSHAGVGDEVSRPGRVGLELAP